MKKRWFVIMPLLVGVIVVGVVAFLNRSIRDWGERPFGEPEVPIRVIIDRGTPARQIVRQLFEMGFVSSKFKYLCWLKINNKSSGLQAGVYHIATPITPSRLTQELGRGMFLEALAIPEGWTSNQIGQRLVSDGWLNDQQLWEVPVHQPARLTKLDLDLPDGVEGFLFPDTYRLGKDIPMERLILKMLDRFLDQWLSSRPTDRDFRSEKLSIFEIVTLASIVQREARAIEEMPRIASVFLNRMHKRMKLQSCATVHYALGGVWDRALLRDDLVTTSPFNTYLHGGLPPGPICNPGRDAIESVLRPADTSDLYFVYDGAGQHIFSRTYSEHRRAKRSARRHQSKGIVTGQGMHRDN